MSLLSAAYHARVSSMKPIHLYPISADARNEQGNKQWGGETEKVSDLGCDDKCSHCKEARFVLAVDHRYRYRLPKACKCIIAAVGRHLR